MQQFRQSKNGVEALDEPLVAQREPLVQRREQRLEQRRERLRQLRNFVNVRLDQV